MKPFTLSVIGEDHPYPEVRVWMVKFNGTNVARIVRVPSTSGDLQKVFLLVTDLDREVPRDDSSGDLMSFVDKTLVLSFILSQHVQDDERVG